MQRERKRERRYLPTSSEQCRGTFVVSRWVSTSHGAAAFNAAISAPHPLPGPPLPSLPGSPLLLSPLLLLLLTLLHQRQLKHTIFYARVPAAVVGAVAVAAAAVTCSRGVEAVGRGLKEDEAVQGSHFGAKVGTPVPVRPGKKERKRRG